MRLTGDEPEINDAGFCRKVAAPSTHSQKIPIK
jgi:hypothetical protein